MSRRPLFPPVFSPTASHPLVDDFSMRAARHQARQAPNVPLSAGIPLRNHPMWSGNNELGRETPFSPDANNRQMVLKMEEWGPPEMWNVALGLQYDAALTPNPSFGTTAEILFGVGGTVQRVEIDWRQGASINVPANTIVVNATFTFPNGITSFSVPPDLVLRASVARTGAERPQPSRTLYEDWPATETAIEVPIPPFAQALDMAFDPAPVPLFTTYTSIFVTFGAAASIAYQGTQLLSSIDFANQLLGAPVPLPIPEGVRLARLAWAPGGIPGLPPNNSRAMFRFLIGL